MKKIIIQILKSLGFFATWIALYSCLAAIPAVDTPAFVGNSAALRRLWWEFVPCAVVLIVTMIFVYAIERGKIIISLFRNAWKNSLIGIGLGILWIGATTIILYGIGVIHFDGRNQIDLPGIWIAAVLLNVIMQEYLMRGYIFSLLKVKMNPATAVIFTTILFTAMHGGAFEAGIVAVLNVITMSVFVSLLLLFIESLLAPIIVHFIWNSIGCLLLGGVSLAADYPSLLVTRFNGTDILTGSTAKMEGSIIVLVMNTLLIIGSILLLKRKAQKKITAN